MRYFLGIDVGSSKTHALIADENGNCVGFGEAPGGNHQTVGYDGFFDAIQRSFLKASQVSDVTRTQIAGAGFSVAGYDLPSDRESHLQAIAKLGLSCPHEIVNDGVNGLLAGTTKGIGVNISAGSGVNCCGRGPNGEMGRIVGNGTDFGEFGGGSEIVWKGLHMVNYAWIKRILPTTLTSIYLEATGAKDELDLMEGLSNDTYHLSPFLAVKVFEAAQAGDTAAREVVHWAGEELAWLVVAVTRQIGMENDEVEIVQSGSVFAGGKLLSEPMQRVILQHILKARIIHLEVPPVIGPVLLGMQIAGLGDYEVREALIQTCNF